VHDVSGYRNHGQFNDGMQPASDWQPSPYGHTITFDGVDGHVDSGQNYTFIQDTGVFSLYFHVAINTHNNGNIEVIAGSTAGSLYDGFFLAYEDRSAASGDNSFRFYLQNGNAIGSIIDGIVLDSDFHHWGVTGDGTTLRFYYDGEEIGSDSYSSGTSTDTLSVLFGRPNYDSDILYSNVSVVSGMFWDRPIAMDQFHRDPYQMYQPRIFQVPVLTQVSGGTTVTASLSEGGSAGDSDSVVATFPRSLTEGAVAGDTRTVTATFRSSISEGGSAGDSDSTIATLVAALTDGAQAGESWTSAVFQVFSDSLSEGGSAGDTFSASVIAGLVTAALSEGSDAGDTFAAALLAVASLSEGGVAGETITTQWDYKIDTTEGGQAGESLLAVVTYPVQITEGVSAGDTWESIVPGLGQLSATLSMAVQLSADLLNEAQLDAVLQTQ
jgi:hypothetical protein